MDNDKLDQIIELLQDIKAQGEPVEIGYTVVQHIHPAVSEDEIIRAAAARLPYSR